MSGLLRLPDPDHLNPNPDRIDAIEQLPESADLEVRRSWRQAHELPGDGPHELVEEGLGRRLHIPATPLNPSADDVPEAVGIAHSGHDDGVIPRQLFEEGLDLGHRAPQPTGVNALLLAPAPSLRDPALQARGDPPAEGIHRPAASPSKSGDAAPARAHLLDQLDRTAERRIRDRIRGPQQEHGQTSTERDQGGGDHASSLQDRPCKSDPIPARRRREDDGRRAERCDDPPRAPGRGPSRGSGRGQASDDLGEPGVEGVLRPETSPTVLPRTRPLSVHSAALMREVMRLPTRWGSAPRSRAHG